MDAVWFPDCEPAGRVPPLGDFRWWDFLLGGLSPADPADVTRRNLGVRVYHLGAALGVGSRLRHRRRLPPTAGPAGLGFGVVGVIRERQHAQALRTAKGVVSHTMQTGTQGDYTLEV